MIQLRYMLALGTLLVACIQSAVAQQPLRKPRIEDTIQANVYADNSFKLYINGELVAVDSISFVPHNVVSVDVLPAYPMTIAVMGIDNADPKTGMEYANTNIGDGGFILKLGDGTVTKATWKAKMTATGLTPKNTQRKSSGRRSHSLNMTSQEPSSFGLTISSSTTSYSSAPL